ncbi:MAG: two component LuxR family transcriptional regulator [Herbinix sp.]|nr:two component LuxR family transcriptional regulator [Herbinix sp.]
MNRLKVLLVDDEPLLLESLEIILSIKGNMHIVGKAKDGNAALQLFKEHSVDLAIVDLNMQGMGGIELISELKQHYPNTKVLVLTTFYDENNITSAIKNGADGYLLKDSGMEAILQTITNLMKGQSVIDLKVMQKLSKILTTSSDKVHTSDKNPRFSELTKREHISEGTVKNYVSSIYDKTQIHDRAQLVLGLRNLL